MERRDFLKNVTLAGAGIGLAEASLIAQDSGNVTRKAKSGLLKVALIGSGGLGTKGHLPTILGHPDSQLAAICDVDKNMLRNGLEKAASLQAEHGAKTDIQTFGDYREVLAMDEIDAVVIVTPDHWHVPIAKDAVKAGKDVYVEKPLSFYVTEGRELAELVEKHQAILQVGSQHRSSERFFLAQAAIQSGLIGKVDHVDVMITTREGSTDKWEPQPVPPELDYNMWLGPAQWMEYHPDRTHYKFRFVPEISGGEIANWGAHYLDSAMQIAGLDGMTPISVKGSGRRNPVGSLHTSYFGIDVDYQFANGVSMKLKSNSKGGVMVHGSKGKLYVNRENIYTNPEELLRSTPRELSRSLRKTKGSHYANWISCVKSRRADQLHAPIAIGNAAAILCHLANIAIELERPLFWDGQREIFKNDAHANALLNHPVRKWWEEA